MNPQLLRPFGKAIPIAVSAILLSSSLFPAPVSARTARPVRRPAKTRPALKTPLTIKVPGRAETPVQTLLVRDDLTPLGTNNGVRLWVHGDSSGANLRLRLLASSLTASPAADALPRDQWISTPIPIIFTGWREFVIPQDKFSRRSAAALPKSLDLALPAAAQSAGEVSDAKPDWAAANGLALDVTTSRQAMLVIDDIAWVTLDANGQGTAATPVKTIEKGNVAAWQPVGTPDEIAAVNYGLATQPSQTRNGRIAFRLTVTPPGLARQTLSFSAQEAMNASGKPYIVWLPPSLFAPVLPDSLPPSVGTSGEVTLQACPEQTQAATFCLYTPNTLNNVIVSLPQDLQGIGQDDPEKQCRTPCRQSPTPDRAGPLA